MPHINISDDEYRARREHWSNSQASRTPTTGIIQNLVIFINFPPHPNDPGDGEFTEPITTFETLFNSNDNITNSLYNYFYHASNSQLQVYSSFYPAPSGNTIMSYQAENYRSYYTYPSLGDLTIYYNRVSDLLKAAVQYIADEVPTYLNIDNNNDGKVDNIVFIIEGLTDIWSDGLLWPHASSFNDPQSCNQR